MTREFGFTFLSLLSVLSAGRQEEVHYVNYTLMLEETENNRFCGELRFCHNRIESFNVSPNDMVESKFGKSPCFCDADCVIYGDCCIDMAVKHWGNGKEDGSNLWVCTTLQDEDNIYMVGRCPSDYGDESVMQQCLRDSVPDSEYSHILDVPVFSSATNRTYVNVFCAHCNQAKELVPWTLHINCSKNVSQMFTVQELMKMATYSKGLRMWSVRLREEGVFMGQPLYCNLRVNEFQDFSNYLSEYNGRKCRPQVRECKEGRGSWSNSLKCDMYSLLVKNKTDGVVYKNPHCAACNRDNKTTENLACHETLPTYRKPFSLPLSFAVVFDFQGGFQVGKEDCDHEHIWDALHGRCHAIVCGRFYTNRNGRCVARNLSLANASSFNVSVTSSDCFRILLTEDEVEVFSNGSLVIRETGKEIRVGEYEIHNATVVLVCASDYRGLFRFSPVQSYFSLVCLVVSLVCSALHIFIYTSIPKLRNLPGKNLLSLTCSLFVGQFLFVSLIGATEGYGLCLFVSILLHYFLLASLFWMNVMSFDVFRTFTAKSHRVPDRSSRSSLFMRYSIYGWGTSALIVAAAIITEFTNVAPQYRPAYARNLCWINSKHGLGLFFVLPVGGILLENIILFVLTAHGIYSQQQAASFASKRAHTPGRLKKGQVNVKVKEGQPMRKERIKFFLYLKLALIMGLGWIFGFVASLGNVDILWFAFIFFNGLQGAFIFLGFDLKRKILYLAWEKVTGRPMKMTRRPGTASTGVDLSSPTTSKQTKITFASKSQGQGQVKVKIKVKVKVEVEVEVKLRV
ncbi:unnamed protein product [Darwinula stevensoni]|uniref:G-protein coupled receptors family 2 profile 2 domain-containing protein n=1 Tax=Darwinula stevensoni TaxID=69355 RepID=A0A7R8X553_9CRUS|nr:unnamed protein product [Darwinula stevensoni]CAG0884415.1 unnamed protein product [Darwinula stevensoni]